MGERLLLVAATLLTCQVVSVMSSRDYCIVGAGPSGLQLGSLLQMSNRDYIIYERGGAPGECD